MRVTFRGPASFYLERFRSVNSESAMSNSAASFEPYRRRLLGLASACLGRWLTPRTRARPHPGQWWREDFTVRLATVNGLPGVIVDAPEGVAQTAAVRNRRT